MVLQRGDRESLPGRREGYAQRVYVGGQRIYLATGNYGDGRLGEIFLQVSEPFEEWEPFALAVSVGLQHGVPLEKFVEAFLAKEPRQQMAVVGHERIKQAKSIEDYLFRELAITYLGRDDLGDYESYSCEDCGQLRVVRNGTCRKCMNCGATRGCS